MKQNLNKKVLILGSTGLLGSTLSPFLMERAYTVITHGRGDKALEQCDLDVPEQAFELLEKIKPEIIINLVGLTDVDQCEREPHKSYLTNVHTVENIAQWIKKQQTPCHLLHISTDQVYDDLGPHVEEKVKLTNFYAFSKYSGELAATSVPSTVLRTNFFGRSHCLKRDSFTDWLFKALSNNEPVQVFDDVLFSPLSMNTLVEMIELAIRKKPIGIFNLGAKDGVSKADFAFAFAKELGLDTNNMKRTTSDQVEFLKTYRPKDMRMDCTKFENTLDINLPFLENELKKVAQEYA